MRTASVLLILVTSCVFASAASAQATITVTGAITQSTSDGTGPAVFNPSLNNITDGDAYSVTLSFTGSITAPGTYTSFSGADFSDPTAPANESSFSSVSLTVLPPSGGMDQISVLGCLSDPYNTTNGGCFDQLDLNFMVPAGSLNAGGAAAQPAPCCGIDPLDLLEDGGTTDIQGNVATYSYTTAVSTTPEPTSIALYGSGLIALALKRLKRQRKNPSS
jgi:hypothetical protein